MATIVALAVMATACSDELRRRSRAPVPATPREQRWFGRGREITVPDGFEVSVLADGFEGPTQIADGGDGSLVVAQLNGGESDASGQVLRVPIADPDERDGAVRQPRQADRCRPGRRRGMGDGAAPPLARSHHRW
ncbi:MAG: hypothetical protein WKF58_20325 [Ilumatobacteraceae bacterium]